MDYTNFSAIDFAADQQFVDWVVSPDAQNTAFWNTYLSRHPQQEAVIAEARRLVLGWSVQASAPSPGTQEAVWAAILAERNQKPEADQPKFGIIRIFRNNPRYLQWAAVLAVVVGMTAYGLLTDRWGTTRYATGNGETRTVQLPDGSTVVLNANSSIAFPANWDTHQPRTVRLDGEGFFSVTHQPNHQKFAVVTPNNLRVEVLGTVFTVAERANKTRVVLNSGKVVLYTDKSTKPLLMKPGELVEVAENQRQEVVRRQVTPAVYSAWKDDQFVFDNTPLGEVASLIESNFGYTVRFADDSLKNRRVTIRLAGRDLDLLLESVAEMHDLTIDRSARRILIKQNPTH